MLDMTDAEDVMPLPTAKDRQKAIEALDVGDTVSRTVRVNLAFGINPQEHKAKVRQVRGALDSQVNRTRRKYPSREFVVENVTSATSKGDALLITAAVSRTG